MKRGSIFETDGIPRIQEALPLALQHVVAMIVGCVTPAIIVAGAAGLENKDQVILIQAALVVAALSTLLQLFPIGKKYRIGSGLPVIMGVSFAYVPSMQAIADGYGIDTILGAQIVGGVVAVIMGIMVKKIRVFFPPLITGTVVFTIGLSLYPTAINYMAGGTSNPDYGSWQNWLVAFFTLAVVTVLNHFGKGIWKLSSILIGMLAGYVVSIPFGMVDLSSVGKASVFQVPQPLHFGVHFEISACVAIGLLFAINSIQAIGDYSATTIGAMNRTPKDSELQDSDRKILGVVTDRYKVIQNEEAFAFTDALLGEGVRYETAGSLQEGRRVWLLARLPREYIIAGERISPYMVFSNTHDGFGAVKTALTPIRVVCNNTLNLALRTAKRSWSMIHTGDISGKIEEAKNTLFLADEYMSALGKEFENLRKIQLSEKQVMDYIEILLPVEENFTPQQKRGIERLREDMGMRYFVAPDLKDVGNNGYRFVNAVSDFATHSTPRRKTANYKENIFARTADGNPLIDRAYQMVLAA